MISSVRRASSSGGMVLEDGVFPASAISVFSFVSVIGSPKELARIEQRTGQRIHFRTRIVHGKGCPAGGGNAETLQQRLGAMGSGANRDARAVDHHGYVMGVDAFELEGDDGPLSRRGSVDFQRIDLRKPLMGIIQQIRLVGSDPLAA